MHCIIIQYTRSSSFVDDKPAIATTVYTLLVHLLYHSPVVAALSIERHLLIQLWAGDDERIILLIFGRNYCYVKYTLFAPPEPVMYIDTSTCVMSLVGLDASSKATVSSWERTIISRLSSSRLVYVSSHTHTPSPQIRSYIPYFRCNTQGLTWIQALMKYGERWIRRHHH